MKRLLFRMLFVGAFSVAAFTKTASAADVTAGAFSSYADAIRARADYVRAVGEARLNWARSEYQLAIARGAQAWARMLEDYAHQLELDLRRLNQDIVASRHNIESIQANARTLSVLSSGRTSPLVWASMRYFEMHVLPADSFVQAISLIVDIDAKSSDNFVSNRGATIPTVDFVGTDVGDLLGFLEENNYSIRHLKPAHRIILQANSILVAPADVKVKEINEAIESLRTGVFSIWNPPFVNGVPGDTTVGGGFPGGLPPVPPRQ